MGLVISGWVYMDNITPTPIIINGASFSSSTSTQADQSTAFEPVPQEHPLENVINAFETVPQEQPLVNVINAFETVYYRNSH